MKQLGKFLLSKKWFPFILILFIVFIIKHKEHGLFYLDGESFQITEPPILDTDTLPKAQATKEFAQIVPLKFRDILDDLNNELITSMRSSCPDIHRCHKQVCLFVGKTGKSICQQKDEEAAANVIKKVYLDLPSNKKYHFKINPPELRGQIGVPAIVDKLLHGKKNGFFIESGGYNGEDISNSLFFEMKRNFSGLLVEPNIFNYKKLLGVNRKSFSLNACYSTSELPMIVDFVNAKALGSIKYFYPKVKRKVQRRSKIKKAMSKHTPWFTYQGESKALCLSFYSVLLAVGNPVVDYFSLDIEGAELPVLQTIPWNKVDIRVLSIECGTISRCNQITVFMNSVGYKLVHHVPSISNPQDVIFMKK
jgi:hypothetical protein